MRRILILFLLVFIVPIADCRQITDYLGLTGVDFQAVMNAVPIDEKPIKVSLCDLQNNPLNYNHKLIEVKGFVSFGFENFTIFDPLCTSRQCVWLEYGGMAKSGTIYCCGETPAVSRPEPLVVEDIPISLVDDEKFKTFDKLLSRPPDAIVHATIQGRFFSGEKMESPKSKTYGGYGHFGMCSLLAIQQVVDVDSQENKDLDYRSTSDPPEDKYLGEYGAFEYLDGEKGIDSQKKAENGDRAWSFDNPQKVASEYLARLLKINKKLVLGIKQIHEAQGRFIYYWRNKRTKIPYIIVVSRPYWLSYYAKDPKRVAWIVIESYKIT